MQLTSPAFADMQQIPQKFGKKIENVSIPLAWKGAPAATKSFAISMVDYLSPERYYVHWLVCDIPANVTHIDAGASTQQRMPAGAAELKPYVGPFPPSGTHTYTITLYALRADTLTAPP